MRMGKIMNKFVYTITSILFVIIAGVTAYMVIEKEEPAPTVVAEVEEPVAEEQPVEVPVVEESEPVEEVVESEEPAEEIHYYKYKVVNASWLHIRALPGLDSDPIGKLPRNYTGYVVKMTGDWTLVSAEGFIGYCSDDYLELEEIDVSEFPEQLMGYDETAAGTTIAEGRIGEVEEANTKSVKWF